ncbi:peptide chain release factor 1 [Anaerotignum sp.]|nr:peptide chain release factor 1 [Anaerotignum sp.]MBQ7758728.1 peptide chain release factor 1 [Anaerotignum sp.]
MFDRLAEIEIKYGELADQINDPDIIANQTQWRKLMKEYSDMTPIVEKYREYKAAKEGIEESLMMLEEKLDDDFRELVKEELAENKEKVEILKKELTILLIPKDPNDEKNVIVEIRGGAGGDEAALFAGRLFRMYARYAERRKWRIEILNTNEIDLGGFREVSFMIKGEGAYSRLKYESGVHRVQRVPVTESGGRIHTSTATVAVLPEAEEVDVHIDMNDVRVDVFRASGNGGQCVNTTDSAVRMTHIPTGIVVSCQNEKSQLKNKEQALKVLYARVYERERRAHDEAIASDRRSQVGTGDRSERIRTYNFPQGRVTDHRIGLTLYKIDAIMDGDLDEVMDALATTDQMSKMQEGATAE